tara:strand:- start:5776 stop:6402 length:627 start_codon:yes stop_codon:yes gene_type:complete
MSPTELNHTVYIQKSGDGWECGYINRNGDSEAVRRDFSTLNEARKFAAGIWGDVYHGTNNHIQSYPARPKKYPEEYPNLPMREDGSSSVELILPHSEGYHVDGKPRSIVKGFLRGWLNEEVQDDRERILAETIRDLAGFSEKNLAYKLRETELVFFNKEDDARERFKENILEARKEAIEGEKKAWTLIYMPLIALFAFALGRWSVMIF